MDLAVRYSESRRITLYGAAKNSLLALLKITFGIVGHSHALFADGIHSLADLLIDSLVLIASRFGSRAADLEHPYGHGRIETAATLALAFLLLLTGVGIIFAGGMEVMGLRAATRPDLYVVLVAMFSMFLNEVLYRYTRITGERIGSKLLVTNAWHHRSDSFTSLVVVIGVIGAWLGLVRLDSLAAIVVGVLIVKMAAQFGWNSIRELVDTGLDAETIKQINQSIIAVPGVGAVHQLRTRSVGGTIFLDVHILVDPTISVSEGHFIGQQVHFRLMQEVPGVVDVTVHVDPEDDEVVAPSRHLPPRSEMVALLKQHWAGLVPEEFINTVVLHYLAGKVYVELQLPLGLVGSHVEAESLNLKLQQAVVDVEMIANAKVYFC